MRKSEQNLVFVIDERFLDGLLAESPGKMVP